MKPGQKEQIIDTKALGMRSELEKFFPSALASLILTYLNNKIILATYLLDEKQKPHKILTKLASQRCSGKEDAVDRFNHFVIQNIFAILSAIVHGTVFTFSTYGQDQVLNTEKKQEPDEALMELMEIKTKPAAYKRVEKESSFQNVMNSQWDQSFLQSFEDKHVLFKIYEALMYLAGYFRVHIDFSDNYSLLHCLLRQRIFQILVSSKNKEARKISSYLSVAQIFYLIVNNNMSFLNGINALCCDTIPTVNIYHLPLTHMNFCFLKPDYYLSLVSALNQELSLFKGKINTRLTQYIELRTKNPGYNSKGKKAASLDLQQQLEKINTDKLPADLRIFEKKLNGYSYPSPLYKSGKEFAKTVDDISGYLCKSDIRFGTSKPSAYRYSFAIKQEEPFAEEVYPFSFK